MASEKTTNYGLHKWAAEDRVLREEFNQNSDKIDAALNGMLTSIPRVAVGTYAGDGVSGRFVPLSFTPKAVFILRNGTAFMSGTAPEGALAVQGAQAIHGSSMIAQVTDGGFLLGTWGDYGCNGPGKTYLYLAVG